MHSSRVFTVLCLLASSAAQAEIYRCAIDGRTTYRDRPCATGEQQSTAHVAKNEFEGCYSVETSGWESGRSTSLMRITAAGSHYTLEGLTGQGQKTSTLALRKATPAELRDARRLLKFDVTEGAVLVVPAGTPNPPALPIGLYKGRDEYRDIKYFFFGYLGNGWAKPAPCP